jgi:hypothetical protein
LPSKQQIKDYVLMGEGMTTDELDIPREVVNDIEPICARALVSSGLADRDGFSKNIGYLLRYGGLHEFLIAAGYEDKQRLLQDALKEGS